MAAGELSAYLCKQYTIPIDRYHIIGHNEVPYPNTHIDPGYYWDWAKYIGYVREYAGVSDLINPPPILGETRPYTASPSYGVSPSNTLNAIAGVPYSTPPTRIVSPAPNAKGKKPKSPGTLKAGVEKSKASVDCRLSL